MARWLQHPQRVARVIRADVPPVIDSVLDDQAWLNAPLHAGFIQRDPDEGQPATERAEFSLVYDDEALYIAGMCYDSQPDRITSPLARRDDWRSRLDLGWGVGGAHEDSRRRLVGGDVDPLPRPVVRRKGVLHLGTQRGPQDLAPAGKGLLDPCPPWRQRLGFPLRPSRGDRTDPTAAQSGILSLRRSRSRLQAAGDAGRAFTDDGDNILLVKFNRRFGL